MLLTQQDRRAALLERFYARAEGLDGSFLVGVTSTGIYCLPSCPARKPKPENVVLLEQEQDALSLGLRACKRCRPDLFVRGVDLDQERLREALVDVRAAPGDFADVAALAARAGVGRTKLNELAHVHCHATPAALLLDARLAHAAQALARTQARVLDVALDAGFEGASAFHANFRARFGLTPRAYRALRELGSGEATAVELPARFDASDLLGFFGRDANGVCERRDGSKAEKALLLEGRPARIELAFTGTRLRYRVHAPARVSATMRFAAHAVVVRQLGLAQDPAAFERRAVRAGHARLVEGRRGTRMPLSTEPFEALVWAIVGQQVNLAFAATCRARLVERVGLDAGAGLRAHPDPARVAALEPAELLPLQYSRRKAEYLVDTARAIAAGELDLAALATEPVGATTRRLLELRGIGPWTVRYLLMRGYGFADCVPVGDAGLVAALVRYFDLDERPDAREQERLLEPFAPHRSLAAFHLWKSLA